MILLYASSYEAKYVDYEPKYCVGVGNQLAGLHAFLMGYGSVILFGSSGLIAPPSFIENDYGILLEPSIWYNEEGDYIELEHGIGKGVTTEQPVKSKFYKEILRAGAYFCCDMESYHVAKICKEAGVKFRSIRYVIDRCDEKIMPAGINWAWRKYQHKRMQLKFNEWLKNERF